MPRKLKNPPRHPQTLLFDTLTPITFDDVYIWLERVPRLPCTSPRARQYYYSFRVAEKIRAHKEAGKFHEAIGVESWEKIPKSLHSLNYAERIAFFTPPD